MKQNIESDGIGSTLHRVDKVLFEEMIFKVQPSHGQACLRKQHSGKVGHWVTKD